MDKRAAKKVSMLPPIHIPTCSSGRKNLKIRLLRAGPAIQLFQPWYHLTQVAVFATEKRPLRVPQTAVLRVSFGDDGQSIAIKASGRATAPFRQ